MSGYDAIKSDKGRRSYCRCQNHNIHTHVTDDKVQFAVTLTCGTMKVENKNKDTSGGATERIRRDISYPLPQERVGGF